MVLPLTDKTSILSFSVLAIFRQGCASWHLSSHTVLAGHERKGQSGPRMSGPSLGRQTQTRMR